jgi:uncharacterized protein YoxC
VDAAQDDGIVVVLATQGGGRMPTLDDRVAGLELKIENMEADARVHFDELRRYISEHIGALKGDVQVLKADVQVLTADVQVLTADVQVLKADVQVLKADVQVLTSSVVEIKGALREEMRRLRASLEWRVALLLLVTSTVAISSALSWWR